MILTSCGKNYKYQKVVVNNSNQDVTVHSGCCGDERVVHIPARSTRVVFECTYQSVKKPSCEDVEGKFSLVPSKKPILKDITKSENWYSTSNSSTVSCTFTIDENIPLE